MNVGVNCLLFSDTVDSDVIARFDDLKRMGFDGIEIPIFDHEAIDAPAIRTAAQECGLELTVSSALPVGGRLYTPGGRGKSLTHLRHTIAATEQLGARVLCGPLYKPVGDVDMSLPLKEQLERAVMDHILE